MKRHLWNTHFFLLLLLVSCGKKADPNALEQLRAGIEKIFSPHRVAQIEFTTPRGFAAIVGAYISSGQPAYVDVGLNMDGETLKSVGLRLRAPITTGTGESEIKYSLRVNFNYFGGPRFYQIDRIHLGNNKKDPSLMRQILASHIYRSMHVPASHNTYAWVVADGSPLGLYTLTEVIDKRFVWAYYGEENNAHTGNLYKCEPPGCNLTWKGPNKSDYLDMSCLEQDGCGLVLKTNEKDPILNNYSDIIDFLDFLNHASEEEFTANFENYFEVDTFLRYLAVAIVISDHDGYLGSIDNFYLYHRPDTGRFVFIPWDSHKSMGIRNCAMATHPTGAPLDHPVCTTETRPLVERILNVPAWRAQYLQYVREILDELFVPEIIQEQVTALEDLIQERISADPNSLVTPQEHAIAISSADSFGDDMNLMEFIQKRRNYLTTLLGDN